MSALTWTTTKPTAPGYYWERWDGSDLIRVVIQLKLIDGVMHCASGGASVFTAKWEPFTAGPNNIADPEWAGPIPTPGETP
jgi:hypothetical protein